MSIGLRDLVRSEQKRQIVISAYDAALRVEGSKNIEVIATGVDAKMVEGLKLDLESRGWWSSRVNENSAMVWITFTRGGIASIIVAQRGKDEKTWTIIADGKETKQ